MRNLLAIFVLAFEATSALGQQDSLSLRLMPDTVNVDKLKYSVRLEFISNKKNEITFQLEPRYINPNELDGVGFRVEHLQGDCYKSDHYSDVHPIYGLDVLKDNVGKMSFGDTTVITLEISSDIRSILIDRQTRERSFIFKGQHRVRAYRIYHDGKAHSTIFSNWLYINFDTPK